jgi:hypothetical protein
MPARMLERLVLDRFEYPGFRGCASWCGLALLPRPDGRTVVIATEREDTATVRGARNSKPASSCAGS